MKRDISKKEFYEALNKGALKLETSSLFQTFNSKGLENDQQGHSFFDTFFDDLNIDIEVNPRELRRIPKSGAFVTVSNNPFGYVDFMALLHLVSARRDDFMIGEERSVNIEALSPYLADDKESFSEVLKASISKEQGLGLFPSGNVESYYTDDKEIADRQWDFSLLSEIRDANVPIIPIYIQGQNDVFFHLMEASKSDKELDLSKWATPGRKTLRMRIGNPISVEEQQNFKDANRFSRFLRVKTMMLGCLLEPQINSEGFFNKTSIVASNVDKDLEVEEIIDAVPVSVIEQELEEIKDLKVLTNSVYDAYVSSSRRIPNILREIGRLREITFRAVGEGTNKAVDLDEYDLYYHHLFVWDTENKKIVGSYRIGKGQEIMNKYGIKGFYTSSLFHMDPAFSHYLERGCELGRSFVRSEYQLKRLPLYLLWQGLLSLMFSEKNNYQYLLGPVSISNEYTDLSKSLIAQFVKKYYFDHELAKLIHPLNEFKIDLSDLDHEPLWDFTGDDFQRFDKLIGDVDPKHHGVPILLKKYIKQSGKILAFNVDPDFNDAIDGFLLLNMEDIPQDQLADLTKNMDV